MPSTFLQRLSEPFRDQFLFKLGILLIPFENFWFAPSHGWAAIAPLAFFAYALWNLPQLLTSARNLARVLVPIAILVALSSLNYFAYPPDPSISFDIYRSLGLGISFLVALDLYFGVHRGPPGPVLRILCSAYWISLAFGLLQLLCIYFEWQGIIDVLEDLAKRSTLNRQRVQFTFTEPSFIAMHLFGVILPMAFIFRKEPESKRLLFLLGTFIFLAFLMRPSLRLRVDIMAVLFLCMLLIPKGRKGWILSGIGLLIVITLGSIAYVRSERVQNVLSQGLYADPSTGSRVLRINASWIGHEKDPVGFVTGHGIGNIWMPFRLGYPEAAAEYVEKSPHDYTRELDQLKNRNPSALLSMPLRLLAELGLVGTLLVIGLLFSRRNLLLYALLLYVYLPFDSYAFYTLWVYLYFVKVRPQGSQSTAS